MSDIKVVKWVAEALQRIRKSRDAEALIEQESDAVWLDLKTAIDESLAFYQRESGAFSIRTNGDQQYVRTVTVLDAANPALARFTRKAVIAFRPRDHRIDATYEIAPQPSAAPADRSALVGVCGGSVRLILSDQSGIDSMRGAQYFLWPVLFPDLPEPG